MATKATAFINAMADYDTTHYQLIVQFKSHDSNYSGSATFVVVYPLSGTASTASIYSAIRSLVTTELTNNGVTFGLLDDVRILNQLLF